MYLADEPLYDWTNAGGNIVGGGTFNIKDIKIPDGFGRNTLAKQSKLSNISVLEGRGIDLNVQTFINKQNKIAPLLPSYQEEQLITDVKELPKDQNENNNNNNTIYGLPKMVVYGGGAVITLAILYFILKD